MTALIINELVLNYFTCISAIMLIMIGEENMPVRINLSLIIKSSAKKTTETSPSPQPIVATKSRIAVILAMILPPI